MVCNHCYERICYCCPECGKHVFIEHAEGCSLDPAGKQEFFRDETGSRLKILGFLTLMDGEWVTCHRALGECGPQGPWSEDLQALVREGKIESSASVEHMNRASLVRLA